MTIAYRDSSAGTNSTTGANTTITLPSTVKGGDLILLLWADGGGTLVTQTTPTGFSVIPNCSINGTNDGTDGWYKIAAGTLGGASSDAGATVTIASSVDGTSANKRIVFAVVYSGAQLGNSASHQDTTASTSHTAPAATAVSASAWAVNLFMDRAGPGSTAFTTPGLTQRQFFAHTGSAACSAVAADSNGAVGSGSKGANTATGTVSTANAAELTVILEPSGGALPTLGASASSNLEPGTDVTLTATSSGTGLSFTQTAGTTVPLSGSGLTRTLTVPATTAGDTLSFTCTDSNGTSAPVSIAVLPATRFVAKGGVWQPVYSKLL